MKHIATRLKKMAAGADRAVSSILHVPRWALVAIVLVFWAMVLYLHYSGA